MDDEPGEIEGSEAWYALGRGVLSREEAQSAAAFAGALRDAARGLARVGGARWALDVLREEIATIEGPAKRRAGRPPLAARASDLFLIATALAVPESAAKLARRLHAGTPGVYGATAAGVEKRIKTIRALPTDKREAMSRAAIVESGFALIREEEASGAITKRQADLQRDIFGMAAEPEKLNAVNADLLKEIFASAGWGNQSK